MKIPNARHIEDLQDNDSLRNSIQMPGNPILTCYDGYNCTGSSMVLTDYAPDLSNMDVYALNFNNRIASCNYIEM